MTSFHWNCTPTCHQRERIQTNAVVLAVISFQGYKFLLAAPSAPNKCASETPVCGSGSMLGSNRASGRGRGRGGSKGDGSRVSRGRGGRGRGVTNAEPAPQHIITTASTWRRTTLKKFNDLLREIDSSTQLAQDVLDEAIVFFCTETVCQITSPSPSSVLF